MTETNAADDGPSEFVCMGCMRIQRDGQWTGDIARHLRGAKTDMCPPCYEREIDALKRRGVLK